MSETKQAASGGILERVFHLAENRTDVRTEVVAGITTFMTMAYIIVVNPSILSRPAAGGGPSQTATVAATCLAAAVPTLLMGLWANYPLALASGLGLNAALAAAISAAHGITWQTMMGVVFVEGCIVAVLVMTRTREWVMHSIPADLKRAIAVGIGLLIAVVGLHGAHWIGSTPGPGGVPLLVPPTGNFRTPGAILGTFGVLVTAVLFARRVRGALLLGIVLTAGLAYASGHAAPPDRVFSIPDLSTFGRLDLVGALQPALVAIVFAFLITDFFDTMGTVVAVTGQSGHLKPDGFAPAPEPCSPGRLVRRHLGRHVLGVVCDHLRRELGRRCRGRTNRPDQRRGGGPVRGLGVLCAARNRRAGRGNSRGTHSRRLHHDERGPRDRPH